MRRRAWILIACGLSIVGGGSRAAAQPAADPEPPSLSDVLTGHARRDYEAGRMLFEVGDYRGALARFLNAARQSSDPRLLWNAAACEMKLRHYGRALRLVHRYLASQSPLITPEAARKARAFVDAAELLTVRLRVESNVPDALVYVNGELLGAVPLGPSAALDLGRHELMVTKEGFTEHRETLTVTGSADLVVHATLRPASPGGGPANAGAAASRRTWEGSAPIGPHTPQLTAPGLPPVVPRIGLLDQPPGPAPAAEASGLPGWLWIVGGSVLAAGAATFGYFILKPSEPSSSGPTPGSISTVQLP